MSILSQNNDSNDIVHKLITLDNVGHCPNHEAPKAVAYAMHRWLDHNNIIRSPTTTTKDNNDDTTTSFIKKNEITFYEDWGDITMREVHDDVYNNMNFIDNLFTSFLIK